MLIRILITLICLGSLVFFLPIADVLIVAKRVDFFTALFVFLLLFLNVFISSIRFNNLIKSAGVYLPFASSHRINVFSQIFGLFTFQTLGQMAFRNLYGARFTEVSQRFALLTLIEKLIAVATLLLLALIGVISITHAMFELSDKIIPIILTIVSIILSITISYIFAFTKTQKLYSRKILKLLGGLKVSQTIVISLCMHLVMLMAYISLAQSILEDTSLVTIAAVFSIVMLSASLPISFAGWGLRELSAGYIFSFLDLDPTVGVFVASVIGVFSLFAMGTHAIVINFLSKPDGIKKRINETHEKKHDFHFERILSFMGIFFIPILIGVQLRLPTNTGDITFNLADPIVFVMAISFISLWYQGYFKNTLWRVDKLGIAFYCFIGTIIYGWLLGIFRFGHIDWATYNRTLGLLVIFAYLLAGSMIAATFDRKVIRTIFSIFTLSMTVYFIVFIANIHMLNSETLKDLQWSYHYFSGFMMNRNALAFALTMFLAIAITSQTSTNKIKHEIIIAILLGLIILTVSRTGMIVALFILMISIWFKAQNVRKLGLIVIYTTIFVLSSHVITNLAPDWIADVLDLGKISNKNVYDNFRPELISRVHFERIASYQWAFDLWKEYPLFGAGLGAFISTHFDEFKTPLTIHNTFLWILVEMGVLGVLFFLPLPLTILAHIRKKWQAKLEWDDLALLLVLVAIVLFSMTHEILYQRVLWFILGILITNKVLHHSIKK